MKATEDKIQLGAGEWVGGVQLQSANLGNEMGIEGTLEFIIIGK